MLLRTAVPPGEDLEIFSARFSATVWTSCQKVATCGKRFPKSNGHLTRPMENGCGEEASHHERSDVLGVHSIG